MLSVLVWFMQTHGTAALKPGGLNFQSRSFLVDVLVSFCGLSSQLFYSIYPCPSVPCW